MENLSRRAFQAQDEYVGESLSMCHQWTEEMADGVCIVGSSDMWTLSSLYNNFGPQMRKGHFGKSFPHILKLLISFIII